MAKCNFHYANIQNPEALLQKAKEAIQEAGGTVTGNATSGSFSIPIPLVQDITGKYLFVNNDLKIEISTKPIIVSCERIDDEIKKNIEPNNILEI